MIDVLKKNVNSFPLQEKGSSIKYMMKDHVEMTLIAYFFFVSKHCVFGEYILTLKYMSNKF